MRCVPSLTLLFRERMDDILALYTESVSGGNEIHCFDKTPKQMLSTSRRELACAPGVPRRLDYEYQRDGRVNIFVAVAPLGKCAPFLSPYIARLGY